MMSRLRVVLVTGAYHPQISSSALQCRAVGRTLADRVSFSVLTTATDLDLPASEIIDGVPVHRVLVSPHHPGAIGSVGSVAQFVAQYRRAARRANLIHLHGVSRKTAVVAALAAVARVPLVITLHTSGQDEPDAIRRLGPAAWWGFRRARCVVSVSPRLAERYLAAGLPHDRLVVIPNGIDLARFRPASPGERQQLKQALGLAPDPVVLFVGFFSRDKRPDFLFDAWLRLDPAQRSTLVYVGATKRSYQEIDPALIQTLRDRARGAGVGDRIVFVDPTHHIERYYRAADVFALSSRREAMPMALLEAMASGLPVVATRMAGVTDAIVTDGTNGLLFDEDDIGRLTQGLANVLRDAMHGSQLGAAARRTIAEHFSLESVADQWLRVYRRVAA